MQVKPKIKIVESDVGIILKHNLIDPIFPHLALIRKIGKRAIYRFSPYKKQKKDNGKYA